MEATLNDLKAVADKVAVLRSRLDKATDPQEVAATKQQLADAGMAGKLHLIKLRELHKQAFLEADALTKQAGEGKARLDACNARLQNLLYERTYYDKEISNCLSFTSAHSEEAIALMPVEEFEAAAPHAAAAAGGDPHQLMLARLHHECNTRKQLAKQLKELQKQKQKKAEAVAARKQRLDNLHSQFKKLAGEGATLQRTLAPQMITRTHNRHAELLPPPLYIIYSQFLAGREALGLSLDVVVKGDTAAAARLAAAAAGAGGDGPAVEEAHQQQQQQQPSKRRRKEASAASSDSVYQVHPLSVDLHVLPPGAAPGTPPLLRVVFQSFTRLGVLGAYARDAEDAPLLAHLFLGDTGRPELLEDLAAWAAAGGASSGNAAAAASAASGGGGGGGGGAEGGSGGQEGWQFGHGAVRAIPYRWVQDLGGLDVLPTLPPALTTAAAAAGATTTATTTPALTPEQRAASSLEGLAALRRQQRAAVVLERLQSAKLAALALKNMLKLLSAKSWPPTALDAALLTTPTSRVVSWGEVSSDATLGDSGPASGTTTPAPEGPPGTTSGSKGQKAAGGGGGGGAESDEEGEVAGGGGGSAEDEMLRGLAEAEEGDDLLATLLSEGGAGTASAAAAAQELAAAAAAVAGGEDTGMEEGGGEEEGAGPASSGSGGGSGVVLAVPTRLYKLVMEVDRRGPGGGGGGSSPDQAQMLEVTALVRVAANYPLTLPVVRVTRLVGRPGGGSSKKGEVLLEPGKALWMEQQANVAAPRRAASLGQLPSVLGLQLLTLRCCAEAVATGTGPGTTQGPLAALAARQLLRGPMRAAAGAALLAP